MTEQEHMMEAIRMARLCRGTPSDPLVGAVAVKAGIMLDSAHRGEIKQGEHAEFTLLRKLQDETLSGSTVYTTLEPCTVRGEEKTPCVDHLIDRKITRVVIGMLDPNPIVSGLGVRKLRRANIQVDLFPPLFMAEIEELNSAFIRALENDLVNKAIYSIGADARHSKSPLQKALVRSMVTECAAETGRVARAENDVPDGFGGYLNRFVRLIKERQTTEHVQAFIRLNSYTEEQLNDPMVMDFYDQLAALVEEGRLIIDYMFMLPNGLLLEKVPNYINKISLFAASIKYFREEDARISEETCAENIVIFHRERTVFTPKRNEACQFVGCVECHSPEHYSHFVHRYENIEQISQTCRKMPGRQRLVNNAQAGWSL